MTFTHRERAAWWLGAHGLSHVQARIILAAGRAYFRAGVNRCNAPGPGGKYDRAMDRARRAACDAIAGTMLSLATESGSLFLTICDSRDEMVLPQ